MTEPLLTPLEQELLGIRELLWGDNIKGDIFSRWSQGFHFSETEPSALVQNQGGPCSIIAPVQAFIVKNILEEHGCFDFKEVVTEERQNHLLLTALWQILHQSTSGKYFVASLCPDLTKCNTSVNGEDNPNEPGRLVVEPDRFHDALRLQVFNKDTECHQHLQKSLTAFRSPFGILLFLYSVLATKGLEQVKAESDTNEALIDETYGYGSQSLINLMITGRAVTYVWDFEQDVGGLKLKGLDRQSQIGYITLMEHLRYLTVGSYYKNPVNPVWILGSETHLTVLFSENKRLVSPETKSEEARRVFKNYDKDGNNFINADRLQDVLSDLELVSEEGYVDIMRRKLDSENLGIILLNAFMDEFFPTEESSTPDTFYLVHYNGLPQSNCDGQVKYRIGTAILLESDLRGMCDSNPMLTCLQTKWPTIEVNWQNNVTPSLN